MDAILLFTKYEHILAKTLPLNTFTMALLIDLNVSVTWSHTARRTIAPQHISQNRMLTSEWRPCSDHKCLGRKRRDVHEAEKKERFQEIEKELYESGKKMIQETQKKDSRTVLVLPCPSGEAT